MDKKKVVYYIFYGMTLLIGGLGGLLIISGKCEPYYGILFFVLAFLSYVIAEYIGKFKSKNCSKGSKKFSLIHILSIVFVCIIMAMIAFFHR